MANNLTTEKKSAIIATLVEDNSLRSTVRMTGVHRTTIQTTIVDQFQLDEGRRYRP